MKIKIGFILNNTLQVLYLFESLPRAIRRGKMLLDKYITPDLENNNEKCFACKLLRIDIFGPS